MLIAHISDLHLGYSQFNLEEREEDIYDAFDQAINISIKEGVKLVILSGDLFHMPKPQGEAIVRFGDALKRLKEKVDAGADYVVTQMFFDNAKYFEFVKKAREMGITVPIIPGIKPIAVQKHLQILPQIFRIDLPEDLISAVDKCKNNAEIRQVGIEWAIQQSKELKAAGVPVLHYYSMGKSENIRQIASQVF